MHFSMDLTHSVEERNCCMSARFFILQTLLMVVAAHAAWLAYVGGLVFSMHACALGGFLH